jgi:tetratricopeptide (TPR) repeat protein
MPGARAGIEPRLLLEKLRRIGLMTVVFGFFAFTAFAAAAIPAGDRFDEATAAYEQDDLAAAEAIYVEALEKNPGSSSALYNLGNCAYRRGQFGKAIAFFERARRLAPRDPDILANLNFVRSELNMTPVNAIDDPISLLASLRDHLRPDEWLVVAATGWCLTLIMVGFWRRRRFLKYRWTVLIPATLCILACAALFMQKRNTYRSNQGVVIAADIPVFAVPQPKQTNPKMHLRQGDYVSIEEERGAWIRVRIDQAEGWLESKAVGRIWGER